MRTTANTYKNFVKFGHEIYAGGETERQTDRQTHRHVHRSTSHPYRRHSNNPSTVRTVN